MLEQEFRDRNGVFVAVLRDDGSLYVRRSVLDSGIVDAIVDAIVAARLEQRGQFASCARCYRPVERCDCNAPRPAGHTCGKTCDCGTDAG